MLLVIPGCDKPIVPVYAGSPYSRESSDKLIWDKNYRRFSENTSDNYKNVRKDKCWQCPKYDVEATLSGRLDIAANTVPEGLWKDKLGVLHDQSGKFVGKAGFGHPPVHNKSVSNITANTRPKPKNAPSQ